MKTPGKDSHKQFAEVFAATLAHVRQELSGIQEELLDLCEHKIDELTAPMFQKILERIETIESSKKVLEEKIIADSKRIFEEHVHNHVFQEINVDIPEDVVREASLDFVKKNINDTLDNVRLSIQAIRDNEKNYAAADHNHDGRYAMFDHVHDDMWMEYRKLERQQTDDVQAALSRQKLLQDRLEAIDQANAAKIKEFTKQIADDKAEALKAYKDVRKQLSRILLDIVKKTRRQFEKTEREVGRRISKVESDQTKMVLEFDLKLEEFLKKVAEELKGKADKEHSHKEFSTFADKNHTHKEFGQIDKRLDSIESKMLLKSNLKSIIDEVAKKVPSGKDGEDGKQWEFKFDPKRRGMLLYKREDEQNWKKEDILGPQGKTVYENGGGGFGGGGSGAGLDIQQNGVGVSTNVSEINFTGSVNVTKTSQGHVTVAIVGGGGSSTAYDEDGNIINDIKTVIAQVTTNSSGHFTLDYSAVGLTTVLSYDVDAQALSDDALDPVERMVAVSVEDFDADEISGTAFIQRKLASGPGRLGYAMKQAPSGVVIRIKVIGQ